MRNGDLKHFRDKLLVLRARLADDVDGMVHLVPEMLHTAGDLSHTPTHNADRDSEGFDREVLLIHNEEDMLEAVDEALRRLDEGSYGTCAECGHPIAKARLEALPYTPRCIRCAQQAEREAAGG